MTINNNKKLYNKILIITVFIIASSLVYGASHDAYAHKSPSAANQQAVGVTLKVTWDPAGTDSVILLNPSDENKTIYAIGNMTQTGTQSLGFAFEGNKTVGTDVANIITPDGIHDARPGDGTIACIGSPITVNTKPSNVTWPCSDRRTFELTKVQPYTVHFADRQPDGTFAFLVSIKLHTHSTDADSLQGQAGQEIDIPTAITTLVKTDNGTNSKFDNGTAVKYTYNETNTGTTELSNVSVTDDKCSPVTPANVATLASGQSVLFTCTTIINTADKTITNTAHATGTDINDTALIETATDTIKVIHPSISVTKTGDSKILNGSSTTFNYVVTNTGDTVLSNVNLTDNKCSPIAPAGPYTLAANGGSQSASCTTTLKQDTTNTVTATGTDQNGKTVNATAIHFTKVYNVGFTVSKTCSPKSQSAPGTITWNIVVKNTGTAHETISVVDSIAGGPSYSVGLDAGQQNTTKFNSTNLSPGIFTNTATATGTDQNETTIGSPLQSTDSCQVNGTFTGNTNATKTGNQPNTVGGLGGLVNNDTVTITGIDSTQGNFIANFTLTGFNGGDVLQCKNVQLTQVANSNPIQYTGTCVPTTLLTDDSTQHCWDVTIIDTSHAYSPNTLTLLGSKDPTHECVTITPPAIPRMNGGGRVDPDLSTLTPLQSVNAITSLKNAPKNTGTTYILTHGFELHCNPINVPNNLEVNFPAQPNTGSLKGVNFAFHMDRLDNAFCVDAFTVAPSPPPSPPGPKQDVYYGVGEGRMGIAPLNKLNGPTGCGAIAFWTFTDGDSQGKTLSPLPVAGVKGEPGKVDRIVSLNIYAQNTLTKNGDGSVTPTSGPVVSWNGNVMWLADSKGNPTTFVGYHLQNGNQQFVPQPGKPFAHIAPCTDLGAKITQLVAPGAVKSSTTYPGLP